MLNPPPVVLTIAGFDPSSGAGVTADVKTIAAHGCYGVTCVTALTVQSTRGVRGLQPIKGSLVSATLDELAADLAIAAVHIGMLANADVARAVVRFLKRETMKAVVLDPVLLATFGGELLDSAGLNVLKRDLLPLVTLVTPNVDEAATLTGMPVHSIAEMKAAACKLHDLGASGVVITGGHLRRPIDLLSMATGSEVKQELFQAPRLRSRSTHGTGCAFSTALTCNLACGVRLPVAVRRAKEYVGKAIASAYPIGHGAGPLHHLYRWNHPNQRQKTKRKAQ